MSTKRNGWIGCDLDGTLAMHVPGEPYHPTVVGAPVEAMVRRVQDWLKAGAEVRIVTARVAEEPVDPNIVKAIDKFCIQHFGRPLPVTCRKDYGMVALYDDRAYRVRRNEGTVVEEDEEVRQNSYGPVKELRTCASTALQTCLFMPYETMADREEVRSKIQSFIRANHTNVVGVAVQAFGTDPRTFQITTLMQNRDVHDFSFSVGTQKSLGGSEHPSNNPKPC